jgi:hypothetical protein
VRVKQHKPKKALVICLAERARKIAIAPGNEITILPWQNFLEDLWAGFII